MPMNTAFETTLGSLATTSGIIKLQEYLTASGKPATFDQLNSLLAYLRTEVTETPSLGTVKLRVKPTFGGGRYFHDTDIIEVTDPLNFAVLAHEIGHVKSLGHSGAVYKHLQQISRKIMGAQKRNEGLILPLLLTLPIITHTEAGGKYAPTIRKILGGAAIGTAISSLPTLYEETKASLNAIEHAKDKTKVTAQIMPGLLNYARVAGVPALAYYVTKRLV